jgi:hypothetical protein
MSHDRPMQSAPPAAPAGSNEIPAWFECELFCIGDYAGVGRIRCGWRGKYDETRWDPTRRVRPCPRCGEATLMELDFTQNSLGE